MTSEAPETTVVSLQVNYDGWNHSDPYVAPRQAEVAGDPDELFTEALRRTFGPPPEDHPYAPIVPDPNGGSHWLGMIEEHVTLGDAASFADGEVLHIDVLGRGGGPDPFLWDVISTGMTLASFVQGGFWGRDAIMRARSRNKRVAARDWVDLGTDTDPRSALRGYVFEENEWTRKIFDRTFGLDRESGSTLLRRLGYRKVSTTPELWRQTWEDG